MTISVLVGAMVRFLIVFLAIGTKLCGKDIIPWFPRGREGAIGTPNFHTTIIMWKYLWHFQQSVFFRVFPPLIQNQDAMTLNQFCVFTLIFATLPHSKIAVHKYFVKTCLSLSTHTPFYLICRNLQNVNCVMFRASEREAAFIPKEPSWQNLLKSEQRRY